MWCRMIVALTLSVPVVAQTLPDAEIRKILVERIDGRKQGVGIVVGIIDPSGRRVVSYGSFDTDGKRPVDSGTVFEIGSMTKVFTSLAMMDMVQKGEIALTDPISKYLPADVKVPESNGRKITFEDLSMQSSGLPRMPNNMSPKDWTNPYADYGAAKLYEFLSAYTLTRDIGAKYEYSNLAVGLLGYVLSLRAHTDYESLVRARIWKPLGMENTAIVLTPELKARLAPGHNYKLDKVANWDFDALAGCGAIRSTANDILTFLAANLGHKDTPLAPSMAALVKKHNPTGMAGVDVAYGWHMFLRKGDPIIWHNGGTGGYQSFMGYDPKTRVGVVVLSNSSTPTGIDDIGRHLLWSEFPLSVPPKE